MKRLLAGLIIGLALGAGGTFLAAQLVPEDPDPMVAQYMEHMELHEFAREHNLMVISVGAPYPPEGGQK